MADAERTRYSPTDPSDWNTGPLTVHDALNEIGRPSSFRIDHTAEHDDDHALEIDCDAAGFGDVKAIDIVYTTGAVSTGESEEGILIALDETAATGGDISGVQFLATEGGADQINGLFVGVGIGPIEQLSGTFGDMDSILNNATDVLTELQDGGAGNISAWVADNDTMTIGDAAKFEELEFILGTGASGAGIAPTFEFSTGVGTWSTFSPTDATNGMRNTGVIAWLDSDISSWAVGTGSEYLIRITRTRNNLNTTPIVDEVQISAATEYKWDKNGDVSIANLEMNTGDIQNATLIEGANIAGFAVRGFQPQAIGAGSTIQVRGGHGQTSGIGGDTQIKGGNGAGSSDGGDILIQAGTGAGAGADGRLYINDSNGATQLSTTAAGLLTLEDTLDANSQAVTNFPHVFTLQWGDGAARTSNTHLRIANHAAVSITAGRGFIIPFDFTIVAVSGKIELTTVTSGDVELITYVEGSTAASTGLTFLNSLGTGHHNAYATGLSATGNAGDSVWARALETGTMGWQDVTYIIWIKAVI